MLRHLITSAPAHLPSGVIKGRDEWCWRTAHNQHLSNYPLHVSTVMKLSLVLTMLVLSALVFDLTNSFSFGGLPFNNTMNWLKCMKAHIDIAFDSRVIDYGAVISARLADLAERGGGAVRLLNGAYNISSPVVFTNNTCLIGQSINGVLLKVVDYAPKIERRGVLHGILVHNVTVRDITVDVNKMGQNDRNCENQLTKYGSYFEASHFLWFNRVRILNACSYGFDFPGNGVMNSTNVVVEKSFADSAGRDGIKVFRSEKVAILYTVGLNNGRHAVSVGASVTVILEGNTFSSDGAVDKFDGCGILLSDRDGVWSSRVLVSHNRVHNSYRAGICLGKVFDVMVADSVITNYRRPDAPCYEVNGAKKYNIVRGSCYNKNLMKRVNNRDEDQTVEDNSVDNKMNSNSTCDGRGIERSGVCCPFVCVICGGVGCSKRAPHGSCCVKNIRNAGNSCRNGPPPCNV